MLEDKQQLIRDAATQVFSRLGFHQARMEEVANEANVSVGTIYNYFESKEDLLLSIFSTEFEEKMKFFAELHNSDMTIPEQIERILQSHFSVIQERLELAVVLLRERFNPGEGFKEKLLEVHKGIIERIEQVIEEGIRQGEVRRCNSRIAAYALFGVVQSISACRLTYPEDQLAEMFESAPAELAGLIWKGLRKEG